MMKMLKKEKINFLLRDFERMHPNSNRSTKLELYSRLSLMKDKELQLLVDAIKKEGDQNEETY